MVLANRARIPYTHSSGNTRISFFSPQALHSHYKEERQRKTAALLTPLFSIQVAARADFSYTSTRKTTGGAMAAMAGAAGNGTSKIYIKGQKMMTDQGNTAILIDLDAQTITTIDNTRKTYTVRGVNDPAPGPQVTPRITADAKETGQRRTINGFDAKEFLLTMEMEMPQGRAAMIGKMQIEIDMWIASGVPGAAEMRSLYVKNSSKFPGQPWAAEIMRASSRP